MPLPRRRTALAALALAFAAAAPASVDAQLRDGFRSTLVPRGDDTVTPFVSFGFDAFIRGETYTAASACMNGYLSLAVPLDPNLCVYPGQGGNPPTIEFLAQLHGTAIAPLYRDLNSIDPASGRLGYGSGTIDGRLAFGFTWDGVESWFDPIPNFFQVILVDRSADFGAGAFDIEYNWGALEAGNPELAAGLADDGGFTGTAYSAAVTASPNSRALQCVRGGSVNNALCAAPTAVVPEPGTVVLTLSGLGVLAGVAVRRRRVA